METNLDTPSLRAAFAAWQSPLFKNFAALMIPPSLNGV
jgi:hypothetical protein